MPTSNNPRRSRATLRNTTASSTNNAPIAEGPAASGNGGTTATTRNRPRATPSGRYHQFHRRRQQPENSLSGGLQGLEEAGVRLAQISSNIEEILDRQIPPNLSSSLPRSLSPETENHQHRTKRRKLDSSKGSEFTNHKYGWFGQVEPALLKMEIASCDGGYYGDGSDGNQHRPENVLRKDKSVYCTKRSKCDMVLRHQGETPFSVEKIHIESPNRGFTAP